jgi:hypothetical protein
MITLGEMSEITERITQYVSDRPKGFAELRDWLAHHDYLPVATSEHPEYGNSDDMYETEGSWDEVSAAHHTGLLTRDEYKEISAAALAAKGR